jgi:hypothetical protein
MSELMARLTPEERRGEWVRYYSPKRIYEQLLQVHLLDRIPVNTVLEIGPYYGLVTAMLDNAGYDVTTLDHVPLRFERPRRPHIEMDLTAIDTAKLKGFDCIMCCATLEHIPYDKARAVLRGFRESGAPFVLISVPYQGHELFFQTYFNRHMFNAQFSWKKLRFLKNFSIDTDPTGHKWEIGYKGMPLRRYEAMLKETGFTILRRTFSYPSFAVFHLLANGARITGRRL